MTKRIRSIVLALAASLPLGVVFTVPAYAEDTGLIRHLNEQTRAQVKASKSSAVTMEGYTNQGSAVNPKTIENPTKRMGAGIRG